MIFGFFSGGFANNNKHVQMRIVDDKLKIIDDVPTSAVEMAVKEKVSIYAAWLTLNCKKIGRERAPQ